MADPTSSSARGIACVRCAYPLPDLSPSAVCPECGTPVEQTLRGDRLGASDPAYLHDLVTGLSIMLRAALITACGCVVFGITVLVGLAFARASDVGWFICSAAAMYAGGLVWPRGLKLLARPEALAGARRGHESVRACAGICARWQPPVVAALLCSYVLTQIVRGLGMSMIVVDAIDVGLVIPAGTLVCVQLVVVPWHILLLASRIPSGTLKKSSQATLIVGILFILGVIVEQLSINPPVVGPALRVIVGLGMLAWPFAMLMLLEEGRNELDKVRRGAAIRAITEGPRQLPRENGATEPA